MSQTSEQRKAYIEALREERRGYEARGLPDRVKQVDAAIRGLTEDASSKPQVTRSKK